MHRSLLLLALMSTPAAAHDHWINRGDYKGSDGQHCCGPNDCFRVPGDRIKATPRGYVLLDYNETVPYSQAIPSEDRSFWRCKKWDGSRRCFFAPSNSF